jgi:predicted ATP-dependent serine protease
MPSWRTAFPPRTLKIKQAPELFATGMTEVDRVLGGGIPRDITEVFCPPSTGKTFVLPLGNRLDPTVKKRLRLGG